MAISSDAPVMTMPVAPTSANGGFGGFGGDGWWIILFFIVLFGWGGNGWGGNGWGGNNGGVMDGYILTSDFANIERKLDGVNNGLCDGFYAMNTGMLNGFAGVTQAVTNGFYSSELSRCNQQAALMQQLNACRCRLRSAAVRTARQLLRCVMIWRRRLAILATPCRTQHATLSTSLCTASRTSTRSA